MPRFDSPDTDKLLLDWMRLDWREQVAEAFKRGVSVSLIARPDARGDLKSAILGLAAEPVDLGFLQGLSTG